MNIGAGLLLALAALAQVTLVGRLDAALPAPNLVLLLCTARVLTADARSGMWWALIGGSLLDLAGAVGPLGVHALAMIAAAYAVGLLAGAFEESSLGVSALAALVSGVIYGAVVLGAADSLGLAAVPPAAAARLVMESALVAIPGTVVAVAAISRLRRPEPAAPW